MPKIGGTNSEDRMRKERNLMQRGFVLAKFVGS